MADYTIRNLKGDVEDSAPAFGLSPELEARFARTALECETAGVSYQRLAPGFRTPFGHRHRDQEEIYVVVAGGGRIRIDAEVRDLRQWDAVRVAPATMRCIEAGPDGIELLAFGAPASVFDAETVQGWWSD